MTNRQFIKPIVERKKRYENIYTPIFYKAIQRTKAPVLKVAKEHGVLTALTATKLIKGEHFKAAATSLYTTIGPKEAKWLYKELNKTKDVKAGFGFDFNFFTDIVDFLNRKILDKLVTELTETTRNRIYRTIVDGTRDGDSYDEIIRRLEDTELDKSRARLIARTETNRAVNAGHDMGRKAYPYEVDKIWLSARDRRTRGADGEDKADHFHMNEQTVGEEEAFTDHRANVQLMYPGDSSLGAPAATIVNCRCNVRFNPKRDANGRLILRQGRVNIPMGSIPVPNKPAMPIRPIEPVKPVFTPANNLREAEEWAAKNLKTKIVSYQGYNLEVANTINNALLKAESSFVTVPSTQINSGVTGRAYAQFDWNKNEILVRKNYRDIEQRQQLDNETWAKRYPNSESFHAGTGLENTVFHEFGHAWDYSTGRSLYNELSRLDIQIQNRAYGVSGYASSDRIGGFPSSRGSEMIAEMITAKLSGSKSYDRLPIEIRQIVDKYFK